MKRPSPAPELKENAFRFIAMDLEVQYHNSLQNPIFRLLKSTSFQAFQIIFKLFLTEAFTLILPSRFPHIMLPGHTLHVHVHFIFYENFNVFRLKSLSSAVNICPTLWYLT